MKNKKVYVKESVWNTKTNLFDIYYFVFEQSNAKHVKLKKFANKSLYWFEGLTGSGWHRGGWYSRPIINPSKNIEYNIQGFCDGNNVYLLREILDRVPNLKEYY